MTNRSTVSYSGIAAGEPLAWPSFPAVMATLLAAISVTTLFVGLSAVTGTAWLAWVGLAIMTILIASHLWLVWQTRRKRILTCEQLNGVLISYCRSLESSSLLKRHNLGGDAVVLILSEDALHVAHTDPLAVFATVPLYNIVSAVLKTEPARPVLQVSIRTNGDRIHTLALTDFEAHAPSARWVETLQRPR